MTVNIAIISADARLEGVLSQHPILNGVTFSSHTTIDSYKKKSSPDDLIVLDCYGEEVTATLLGDNRVVYLSPKGGSNHLAKPLRIMDLFALLKQMLAGSASNDVDAGSFKFNYAKKILSSGVQQIDLTEKEAEIIMVLLDAKPNAVDKKELLNRVWGYDDNIDTHTLETHMYRLRKKIGDDNFIVTDKDGYKTL